MFAGEDDETDESGQSLSEENDEVAHLTLGRLILPCLIHVSLLSSQAGVGSGPAAFIV